MDELGFKDGRHLVLYKGMKDLEDKIRYFLKNEKEREEIAKNGMNFTRKNHNNTLRVQQFLKIIKEII
jgi:spore maturation protein CgeB